MVLDTPETGKTVSTYSRYLTESLGKTTQLEYYPAHELARKKIALYWTRGTLSLHRRKLFTAPSTSSRPNSRRGTWMCSAGSIWIPKTLHRKRLSYKEQLFILQATSDNPTHVLWTKYEIDARRYLVFNPPEKDEITKASVSYSLFLSQFVTLPAPSLLLCRPERQLSDGHIQDAFKRYSRNIHNLV